MGIDLGILLTYIGAIILIFIFGNIFIWPLKLLLKLALNSLVGGAIILLVNAIGVTWGITIPLTMINALIVGIFGVPGAIVLILLNL